MSTPLFKLKLCQFTIIWVKDLECCVTELLLKANVFRNARSILPLGYYIAEKISKPGQRDAQNRVIARLLNKDVVLSRVSYFFYEVADSFIHSFEEKYAIVTKSHFLWFCSLQINFSCTKWSLIEQKTFITMMMHYHNALILNAWYHKLVL